MTTPRMFEPLDYDSVLADFLTALEPHTLTETDPMRIMAEIVSGYAVARTAQYNVGSLDIFLDTAMGSALDAYASEYQLTRMTGETDSQLRRRVKVTKAAAGGGVGTDDAYAAAAMEANATIVGAAVAPNTSDAAIDLNIYINTATGSASSLTSAVQTSINASPRKATLDRISVVAATNVVLYISGEFYERAGFTRDQDIAQWNANLLEAQALARIPGRQLYSIEVLAILRRGGLDFRLTRFNDEQTGNEPAVRQSYVHTATPPQSEGYTLTATATPVTITLPSIF